MPWTNIQWKRSPLLLATATVALLVTGCGDIFDVQNPGQVLDSDLDDPDMTSTLVTGMSADFSVAVSDIVHMGSVLSDEMAGSSNYVWVGLYRVGITAPEYDQTRWGYAQRARWVAESGLERIEDILGSDFEGNPDVARAYLLAGLSNRLLAENFCEVVFDGGPAVPRETAFERAVEHFTSAISHAQGAGTQEVMTAAFGGRAQAHVGLGNWPAAVADAQHVPTDFVYNAVYSANSGRENNEIWGATWQNAFISAVGTFAASLPEQDPRAPWTDCSEGGCIRTIGADGVTPLFRAEKYTDRGDGIPVVKGTEMRLIEAEALLLEDDVPGAMAKINEVRMHWSLDPLMAEDPAGAWEHLDHERYLTLWLEGRRLHDLSRWDHPFLEGGTVHHPGEPQRVSCFGIGLEECQTNPNLDCG